LAKSNNPTGRAKSNRSEDHGFGTFQPLPESSKGAEVKTEADASPFLLEKNALQSGRFHAEGGHIEPSPTMPRHVSGKKSTKGKKKQLDRIAKNQNIAGHPQY
jgi:hypothetical protein